MIVGTKFLKKHPEWVKRWLAAHVKITRWTNQHPKKAKRIVCKQIKDISGISLPKEIVDDAFSQLEATYDPVISSLLSYAEMAYEEGFLGNQRPDLSGLIDLRLLNEVLKRRSLPLVSEE
jgi:NitT/TauT family transport system substrate-binding protein